MTFGSSCGRASVTPHGNNTVVILWTMVLLCFFSLSSIHIHLHLPFSSANHHLLLLFTDLHCDTMRRVITHPSSFWWKIRDKVQTSLFCYWCRSPHLLLQLSAVLWLWGELKAFIRSIAVLSPRFSWPVICYDYDCVIGWLDFRIPGQTQMEWCLTHNYWKKYLIFYRDPLRLCT